MHAIAWQRQLKSLALVIAPRNVTILLNVLSLFFG